MLIKENQSIECYLGTCRYLALDGEVLKNAITSVMTQATWVRIATKRKIPRHPTFMARSVRME